MRREEGQTENGAQNDSVGNGSDEQCQRLNRVLRRDMRRRQLLSGESRLRVRDVKSDKFRRGDGERREETATHDKDRTNAHRSKVPRKHRLSPCLDIRNPPLQRINPRQPPQRQDPQAEEDQPPGGEGRVLVVPGVEGHGCAEVDEDGAVGEEVNGGGEV